MSNQVTGVVFKVYDKQFPGKPMTYSIKLDGDPLFYRAGSKRFAGIAEAGNRVTFSATPNDDGKSARIDGEVKLAPAATASAGVPAAGDRNASIVYQSSRKDALEFVGMLARTEAIKLPAKVADRLEVLAELVDFYTAQYFEDVNTLGALTRAEAGGGTETAAETKAEDEE